MAVLQFAAHCMDTQASFKQSRLGIGDSLALAAELLAS